MKIAVFPGSFDPITKGHVDIISRALPLFDMLIIGIGANTDKKTMFPIEDRERWIKQLYANEPNIEVLIYSGLTVNFCKQQEAQYMIRGLRTSADFEFERRIAQLNRSLQPTIETLFIASDPALSHVSSSGVRDIFKNGGDVSAFVPAGVVLKK